MARQKKHSVVEKHKVLAVRVEKPLEEIYPNTGQRMIRPDLHIGLVILHILLALVIDLAVSVGIIYGISHCSWYDKLPMSFVGQCVLLYFILLFIYILFSLKRIVIFFIRVYQKFAPYHVRCLCVFIPNCSQYMILAIQKYGLMKGVKKGIGRLKRCHDPNGGQDDP